MQKWWPKRAHLEIPPNSIAGPVTGHNVASNSTILAIACHNTMAAQEYVVGTTCNHLLSWVWRWLWTIQQRPTKSKGQQQCCWEDRVLTFISLQILINTTSFNSQMFATIFLAFCLVHNSVFPPAILNIISRSNDDSTNEKFCFKLTIMLQYDISI